MIDVTGSLQIKNNKYQAVLSYKITNGKQNGYQPKFQQ